MWLARLAVVICAAVYSLGGVGRDLERSGVASSHPATGTTESTAVNILRCGHSGASWLMHRPCKGQRSQPLFPKRSLRRCAQDSLQKLNHPRLGVSKYVNASETVVTLWLSEPNCKTPVQPILIFWLRFC